MKMKEIGGYFGLEQLVNSEYHEDLIALNTGRNALLYIIKAKDIQRLFIPHYLCNSVSYMLKRYDCNFEYYHMNTGFNPIFDRKLGKGDYLYIVNYCGQLTNDKVFYFKEKYGNIILDNVHTFFQRPINGIDTLYELI